MGDQLANNPEALRLFFTEDIYLLQQDVMEPEVSGEDTAETNILEKFDIGESAATAALEDDANVVDATLALPLNEVREVKVPMQDLVEASAFLEIPDTNTPRPLPVVEISIPSVHEAAALYNSSVQEDKILVPHSAAAIPDSNATPEINFEYKGKNARNILILVYDEINDVTTAEGRELFKKIVAAKSLSGNDYAILNFASYKDSTFKQLKTFFNAKVLLTFGVSPAHLGLPDYPQHEVIAHEGMQLMFSADLHEVSLDVEIKKALWTALKDMEL
jgi:hypothetical protein